MIRFFSFAFLTTAVLLLLFWIGTLFLPGIAWENGLLESLQAILLTGALATLLFAVRNWRPSERFLGCFFAVALLSMLLRELEFNRFDLPGWLISLGDGNGRNLLLALLWPAIMVMAVKNRQHWGRWIRDGLNTRWGWSLLLGGGFYLLGLPFDRKLFPLERPTRIFLEEAMETVGALFISLGIFRWVPAKSPRSSADQLEAEDTDLEDAVHR